MALSTRERAFLKYDQSPDRKCNLPTGHNRKTTPLPAYRLRRRLSLEAGISRSEGSNVLSTSGVRAASPKGTAGRVKGVNIPVMWFC